MEAGSSLPVQTLMIRMFGEKRETEGIRRQTVVLISDRIRWIA